MIRGRIAVAIVLLAISVVAMATASAAAARLPKSVTPLGEAERARALITTGDGSLWFGGYRGEALNPSNESVLGGIVGRVAPGGKVEVFATGVDGSSLTGIAVGGDGALWLTDPADDRIVRSTTDGELSFFPLPNPDSEPTSIVAGPEGSLWFTETGRDAIGRITTAGAIEEFPLPAGSEPTRIVAGTNDDFWVAARGAGSIDRMTTAGFLTSFPIGGGSQNKLHDLTVGPDGRVWFTQQRPAIGRLGPSGGIAEFPLSEPTRSARLIVAGADDELWFTTGLPDKEGGPLEVGAFAGNGLASITTTGHATYPTCVFDCDFPVVALDVDKSGALRYGLGNYVVLGGGGAAFNASAIKGYVGTFRPQPAALRLMVKHAPVRGASVELPVECRLAVAGERCHGRLTLSVTRPGRPRRLTVGRGRYDLLAGRGANVRVRLSTQALRLLASNGKLSTKVAAGGPLVGENRGGLLLTARRG